MLEKQNLRKRGKGEEAKGDGGQSGEWAKPAGHACKGWATLSLRTKLMRQVQESGHALDVGW